MSSRHRCNRSILACTLAGLLGTLGASGGACAATTWSVALTSDYVFRGVSQTDGKPALQGGFEATAANGLYAGAWGSSIRWLQDGSTAAAPISSHLELDAYAGHRGSLAQGLAYDVGALYYAYPGSYPAGFNSADTLELYAGLTWTASDTLSLGARYSHAVTDLFGFANSAGSQYLDATATLTLARGWSLGAHAGHQRVAGNAPYSYGDFRLNASKALAQGWSLGLAWTGTDADQALYTNPHGHRIAGDAVALTLTKTF